MKRNYEEPKMQVTRFEYESVMADDELSGLTPGPTPDEEVELG